MQSKSQASPAQNGQPGKIKHLFFRPVSLFPGQEYAPYLYLEAKIDFSDVRTGYHRTFDISSVLDIAPIEADLVWTHDVLRPVNPDILQTEKPEGAQLRGLPEFVTGDYISRVETLYLNYLLRTAKVRIFRNFALNIYSRPSESLEEFESRCLDVFNESFRGDLDGLREVVNRRLEHIEKKYLSQDRAGEFESDKRMAQGRSALHAVAERIAELFLETELTLDDRQPLPQYTSSSLPDLEQQLETVEIDVRREIIRLLHAYEEEVRNIDDYLVHANLRDLHLARICILWMPVGAPP